MAKPRPEKKPEPPANATTRVPPMELRIGDRITDETGEWEVIGRPFPTAGGKNAHARVRKVSQPEATDLRSWSAHERINVKRATTEEGQR
jgi:hypothetical protein